MKRPFASQRPIGPFAQFNPPTPTNVGITRERLSKDVKRVEDCNPIFTASVAVDIVSARPEEIDEAIQDNLNVVNSRTRDLSRINPDLPIDTVSEGDGFIIDMEMDAVSLSQKDIARISQNLEELLKGEFATGETLVVDAKVSCGKIVDQEFQPVRPGGDSDS